MRLVGESRPPDSTGRRNTGLITKEDLQNYATRVEKPVTANYRGDDVFKCGPGTQGPGFPQQLRPGNARGTRPGEREGGSDIHKGDTTHLDAADQWGNMISATPSGGWFRSSPVIEGLGFPLGTRMQMFHLDPPPPNSP